MVNSMMEMESYEKIKEIAGDLDVYMRCTKLSDDTSKELKRIQRFFLRAAKLAHAVDTLKSGHCSESEFMNRIKE